MSPANASGQGRQAWTVQNASVARVCGLARLGARAARAESAPPEASLACAQPAAAGGARSLAGIARSGVHRSKRAAGVHARTQQHRTQQGALPSLAHLPLCGAQTSQQNFPFMAFAATWQAARTCASPEIGLFSPFVRVCAGLLSSRSAGKPGLRANQHHRSSFSIEFVLEGHGPSPGRDSVSTNAMAWAMAW